MARIVLGVTGSVAAVKTHQLFAALCRDGHEVKVAPTGPALAFFDPGTLGDGGTGDRGTADSLPVRGQETVYLDADEWPQGRLFAVGESVLHIELRKWADLLLIAPLDANTLAKVAQGLCDNLLTCVYRAWDLSRPVILAPAMNTVMWEHPATARHLRALLADHGGSTPEATSAESACEAINTQCERLRVVVPQSKRLACGDEGMGGMADVAQIAATVNGLVSAASG